MSKKLEKVVAAIEDKKRSTPEGAQLIAYVQSITDDTQAQTVLRHLYEEGPITSRQAFSVYEMTRLSASIYNLRQAGVGIVTIYRKSKSGKRYGEYRLEETDV